MQIYGTPQKPNFTFQSPRNSPKAGLWLCAGSELVLLLTSDSKVFVEWRSIAREWWSFGLRTEGLVEDVFNCVLGGEPLRTIKSPALTCFGSNASKMEYYHAVSKACYQRRFLVALEGHMRLALPEARIDDIVCAFIGAVDPYIKATRWPFHIGRILLYSGSEVGWIS